MNGLDIFVNKFIIEMENIAVAVADNLVSKELLKEIIDSLLAEEDFNEPLKLKIIEAMQQQKHQNDSDDGLF